MKTCTRCKQQKSLSDFGKDKRMNDGLQIYCKPCWRVYQADWRADNLEHARKLDREQKRKAKKEKGYEHFRVIDRRWYQNNKEHKKRYVAKRRDKKKVWAQNKVNKAIKSGRLIRPDVCSVCNQHKENIIAHHDDYDKPYDIIWLCQSCHSKHHWGVKKSRCFTNPLPI